MFHHVAMFRFREDVAPETIAEIRTRLLELPGKIDAIRGYHVGRDAGLSDSTWDMVVVAHFDDEAGYRAYHAHGDHVPIVQEILPLVTDRAAVQSAEM